MLNRRFIVLCLLIIGTVFFANAQQNQFFSLKDFNRIDEETGESFLEKNVLTPNASDSDLSQYFLSVLFGRVGGLNGRNDVIANVFQILNTSILMLMSFIIGYSVLASVIGSAQDGTGALSNRVHPTTLLRTGLGISLMAPLPQLKGYNLLQYLLMKVVLYGVGLANTTWLGVLAQIDTTVIETGSNSDNVKMSIGSSFDGRIMNHLSELYSVALIEYIESDNETMSFQFKNAPTLEPNSIYLDIATETVKITTQGTEIHSIPLFIPQEVLNYLKDGESLIQRNDIKDTIAKKYRGMLNDMISTIKTQMKLDDAIEYGEITGGEDPEKTIDRKLKKATELSRKLYRCPTVVTQGGNLSYSCTDDEKGKIQKRLEGLSAQFKKLARSYGRTMLMLHNQVKSFTESSTEPSASWVNSARRQGWLSAGIYYQYIADKITTRGKGSQDAGADEDIKFTKESESPLKQSHFPILENGNFVEKEYFQGFRFAVLPQLAYASSSLREKSSDFKAKVCGKLHKFAEESSKANTTNRIPAMWGKEGDGWFMQVEVQKPIQYMMVMVGIIAEKLLGVNAVRDDHQENDRHRLMINGCTIMSNSMFDAFENHNDVDPIKLVRSLGYTMIDESIKYFKRTIDGLYKETITLADKFFGVTVSLKSIAAGAEAALHGSMFAYIANLVATALEIAVSGMQIAYQNTRLAMEMFVPLGTALASVFFTLGVILGIYLPMMPYILFVFSAIAWLMSVAEAMVATPLVALGIAHPEGHDLLGKSEQAMILLLGVFVRPVTILLGLIMAIFVSKIVLLIFHLGFLTVASDIILSSGSGATLGVILAGVAVVYVYVLISVIEQSYALIYQVPERILRWVGGPQDQTGIGQLADQVKSESQQAVSSGASGAGQATSAGQISQSTSIKGQSKQGQYTGGGDGAQAGGAGGGGDGAQAGGAGGGGDGAQAGGGNGGDGGGPQAGGDGGGGGRP